METLLRFILVKCLGFEEIPPKKFSLYTRDPNDCDCCPTAIQDEGCECTCKVDQTEKLDDGTEINWKHRQECSDWDCSYCH